MLIFGVLLSFYKGFACIYNQEPETSIQSMYIIHNGNQSDTLGTFQMYKEIHFSFFYYVALRIN